MNLMFHWIFHLVDTVRSKVLHLKHHKCSVGSTGIILTPNTLQHWWSAEAVEQHTLESAFYIWPHRQHVSRSKCISWALNSKIARIQYHPLPPLSHPLFPFWLSLFQVSGSDWREECQWSAHSRQPALMAVPHTSNRGKGWPGSDRAKCHCIRHYGGMVSVHQAYTTPGENDYKITVKSYTDIAEALWRNVSSTFMDGLNKIKH